MSPTTIFVACFIAMVFTFHGSHCSADNLQTLEHSDAKGPSPDPNSTIESTRTRTGKQSAFFPSQQSEEPAVASKTLHDISDVVAEEQNSPQAKEDSYSVAAKDFGYHSQNQQYPPYPIHQQSGGYAGYPLPSTSHGEEVGYLDNFGNAGIGGIGGLLGLLGLKGLKGLGLLGILKALALPAFLFVFPVLLILPILLLFLPIPLITISNGNRNGKKRAGARPTSIFGFSLPDISGKVSQISRAVMESEKCVERASCEISRYGRGTIFDRTLKKLITQFESVMPNPLLRMARAYMDSNSCRQYACYLMDDHEHRPLNHIQKKN